MRPVAIALVLGSLATSALATDQTILGNQLVVKNPSTPEKRSIVGKAKEVGSANTIVGDPTAGGATLTVRVDGDNPSSQTFPLPQGTGLNLKPFWSGDAIKGFKYKDSKGEQGPVKSAQIKKSGSGTFTIKVKATGKYMAVDVVPPNLGASGCILLEIASGDSYSVAFTSGTVQNTDSRVFKVKKPTIEDTCVIVGPTTSTTSSSTSTTESTTSSTDGTTTSTESTTSSTESTTTSTESTSTSTESTTSSTESTTSSTESTSTSTSSSTSSTESTSTSTSSSTSSTESTSTSTSSSTTTSTSSTSTSTLAGPTLPPDVGSSGAITYTLSPPSGSPGDPGGQSITFNCVDTTWTKLYWGPSSGALPSVDLDATLDSLTYSGASLTYAQWDGMGTWTDPDTGTTYTDLVPIRIGYTITAGGVTFAAPPGIPGTIGAVVNVAPGGTCSTFTVKVEVTADQGGTYVPANTFEQLGIGKTVSSFTGAFYWVP